ncbi:set and ww domain containing protein [Grosmannia clavigera kw1407]|uniref:Histone-lysine N-methyltransferase, H3 lysine-36 specific n=1 Tax=Grosmannia clavigera (strain kw1407 / UAMH 11150) TaxID=655863 RepID=F0XSU3_GROCL|nr:set and ww domain containing protein [Grosmannia clavigera kw1407]EFW99215.1 set and ww domain containing protein [Grosmannia clavigera kw1407]
MTASGVRNNGTRVAVKREGGGDEKRFSSATPNGFKDDSLSPSMSPDHKAGSLDNASMPDTGPAAKLSRKPSSLAQKAAAAAASPRVLFDHLPDATAEAKDQFQVITDCLYGSKHMGSSEHDAFECDCAAEWHDGQNLACGEDSDCINRATKMECVRGDCNCGETCQNQRFQRKQYAAVSVIKTAKKGFGLRADVALRANDFVYEYIGEVINEPAFRRRMLQYDEEGIRHFYFMSLTKHEFVDATRKGNLGRFCNHSCRPNCYVDKWVVGEKLRMGIFASRAIAAGEELVFDYNVDRYGAEPQPCYCGEPNCSGFIGGKTQTERATKLSAATIEALGIDDPDSWEVAATAAAAATGAHHVTGHKPSRPPRRKRANEDDEEYVGSLQQSGLAEDGVTKVMAALMQCKERWIAVKLLARIQAAGDDERVLQRVTRMHGYQILSAILTAFRTDDNVVLQVLDVLDRLPRLTKNKISDSNIESVIESLTSAVHEDVAAAARRLLDAWSKLETAYRIPRKKVDPHAAVGTRARSGRASSLDDDDSSSSGPARQTQPQTQPQSQPQRNLSPFHGMAVPKGPRSHIPQRNANFYNNGNGNGNGNTATPRNARRPLQGPSSATPTSGLPGLPSGWFEAKDPNGTTYYYATGRAATWKRPTQPADKAPSKAQQKSDAVQEIINSIVKEDTPRPSAGHTPLAATTKAATPVAEPKKDRWRSYPIEKQMRIYENTLSPHIRSVSDRYRHRLPKDELKKLAKDISKKLVASDYKNNRVEDPTAISPRVEKKVKTYVRDFFDRAVTKYGEHERKRAEREARHVATTAAAGAAVAVEEDEDGDVVMADSPGEDREEEEEEDAATAAAVAAAAARDKDAAVVAAALAVAAAVAAANGIVGVVPALPTRPADSNKEREEDQATASPDGSPSGRKRKRTSSDVQQRDSHDETDEPAEGQPASSSGSPAETPPSLHKRLREDDVDVDVDLRQMREQEEELMRENEEAMRAFEQEKGQQEETGQTGQTEQKEQPGLVLTTNGVSTLDSSNGSSLEQLQRETQPRKREVVGH